MSVATMFLITPTPGLLCSQTGAERPKERRMLFQTGVPLVTGLRPDDRLVIVEKAMSLPPPFRVGPAPTLAEELEGLRKTADAIVILEVTQANGELTAMGDWIRTRVRSVVREYVKVPARPSLAGGDRLEFDFDGGEMRFRDTVVKAGSFPVLRAGATYLVMFDVHPNGTTWYPHQPFMIDGNGRLARPEVFDPRGAVLESPLYGEPAAEVVERLKRR